MDGPHDLGGKDGFGPVEVDAPPFREDWERRQWALSQNLPSRGGTIDWWRHGVEQMDPATYLSVPYFVKWALNDCAQMIDQHVVTVDEVVNAKPETRETPPEGLNLEGALARARTLNRDFRVEMDAPPSYSPGDRVRTLGTPVKGHTRLPAYARGHVGTVIAHHGGHLFADAGAKGEHIGEHLYTVEFTAAELWGKDDPDTICLDLWEPYLVRA